MKVMTTAMVLMIALSSFAQKSFQESLKFMNANVAKVSFVHINGKSLENGKNTSIRFTEKGFIVKHDGVENKYLWKDASDLENKSVINQVVVYFPGKNKDEDEEDELTFFIQNSVAWDYYNHMKVLMAHNNNIIED